MLNSSYKLGIIPAAGKAIRFGGVLKELLPLPNGSSFLRECYNRLKPYCTDVLVITTDDKIQRHAAELGRDVIYIVQRYDNDIWGAIKTALDIPAGNYLFSMPDTYLDRYTFSNYRDSDFGMGLFDTNYPERFGCLMGGEIVNKMSGLPTPAKAWGVLAWSRAVADYWLKYPQPDYTFAINAAIINFVYTQWRIAVYYDNASITDYVEILIS